MNYSQTLSSQRLMKVLLIEEEKTYCEFVKRALNKNPYYKSQLKQTHNLQDAIHVLREESPHVILLNLDLEDSRGLRTLQKIKEFALDCPIIIITSADNDHLALTAVKMGAQDYLVKQRINHGSLIRSLLFARERPKLQTQSQIDLLLQDLLAVLTHDLKPPLTAKDKVLETLLREEKGKLTDQQKEALHSLRQCNQDLSSLIEKLREIYLNKTSRAAPETEIVNLPQVIKRAISKVNIPEEKTVSFHLNLHPLLKQIFAQEKPLTTLLTSLLENAVIYGDINRPITVSLYPLGDKRALDVHNFGDIIPSDIQNVIFQSFWRGFPGQTYVPRTGLSLYLCQAIADIHHGKMTCFSDENGTRIGLRIPLAEALQDNLLIKDRHAKLSPQLVCDR